MGDADRDPGYSACFMSPELGVTSSSSDEGPRRGVQPTRKSRGRSRAGCLMCKKRRVKCDELRPQCSACARNRFVCYYSSKEGTPDEGADGGLKIIANKAEDGAKRRPLQMILIPQHVMINKTAVFYNAHEFLADWSFGNNANISVYVGFWLQDVLSHFVPAIMDSGAARYAVMALSSNRTYSFQGKAAEFYLMALRYAQKEADSFEWTDEQVLQVALTSVILATFCQYTRNFEGLLQHLYSSKKILHEHLLRRRVGTLSHGLLAALELHYRLLSSIPFVRAVRAIKHGQEEPIPLKDAEQDFNETMSSLLEEGKYYDVLQAHGLLDEAKLKVTRCIYDISAWLRLTQRGYHFLSVNHVYRAKMLNAYHQNLNFLDYIRSFLNSEFRNQLADSGATLSITESCGSGVVNLSFFQIIITEQASINGFITRDEYAEWLRRLSKESLDCIHLLRRAHNTYTLSLRMRIVTQIISNKLSAMSATVVEENDFENFAQEFGLLSISDSDLTPVSELLSSAE